MRQPYAVSLGCLISLSWPLPLAADEGALDKYNCHKHHQSGRYHCHGSRDLAKRGGWVFTADGRLQGWFTDNRTTLFSGLGVNMEYSYRWLGISAGYFYLPLVNAISSDNISLNDQVVQQGWEIALKAGPNVGRKGMKFYLLGGWNEARITADNSAYNADLGDYFVGAGTGINTTQVAIDVAATYRDPTAIKRYTRKRLGLPSEDLYSVDVRFALGWRF